MGWFSSAVKSVTNAVSAVAKAVVTKPVQTLGTVAALAVTAPYIVDMWKSVVTNVVAIPAHPVAAPIIGAATGFLAKKSTDKWIDTLRHLIDPKPLGPAEIVATACAFTSAGACQYEFGAPSPPGATALALAAPSLSLTGSPPTTPGLRLGGDALNRGFDFDTNTLTTAALEPDAAAVPEPASLTVLGLGLYFVAKKIATRRRN